MGSTRSIRRSGGSHGSALPPRHGQVRAAARLDDVVSSRASTFRPTRAIWRPTSSPLRWSDLTSHPPTSKDSTSRSSVRSSAAGTGTSTGSALSSTSPPAPRGRPSTGCAAKRELNVIHRTSPLPPRVFPVSDSSSSMLTRWRLGDRHEHRYRDGQDRDGQEHRPRPRQDHRHDRALGPHYNYPRHRLPTLPQGPARPADAQGSTGTRTRLASSAARGDDQALRDYWPSSASVASSPAMAPDLTIGMGAESRLTVWLRDQIVADEALKADLLGP